MNCQGLADNVEGFAQAGETKTTPRPSDTKIQFYFSEASTHQACAKPGVIGRRSTAVASTVLTMANKNPITYFPLNR
mgnify:CR=1 FL=1